MDYLARLSILLGASLLVACSDDAKSPSGSTPPANVASDGGLAPPGTPNAATPPPASGDNDASATSAGAGTMQVLDNGTTYTLDETPLAGKSNGAGGYSFIASTTKDKHRRLSISLVRSVRSDDQSEPHAETVIPGTYACNDSRDATTAVPSMAAGMQYAVEDQSSVTLTDTWQADLSTSCAVTLEAFDAVGQPTKGTFSATLPRVYPPGEAITISGSWNIQRTD